MLYRPVFPAKCIWIGGNLGWQCCYMVANIQEYFYCFIVAAHHSITQPAITITIGHKRAVIWK